MHKIKLYGSLATIVLIANFLYWLPAKAISTCTAPQKCFFNDAGGLLFQAEGDVNLKAATSSNIYLNGASGLSIGGSNVVYITTLRASGTIYSNNNRVVAEDGSVYNITAATSSESQRSVTTNNLDLTLISPSVSDILAAAPKGSEVFGANDWNYLGLSAAGTVAGVGPTYYLNNKTSGLDPLVAQMGFVRSGGGPYNDFLQFRFNDPTNLTNWLDWREVCDSTNNCRNFINLGLDGTDDGAILMYSDPDGLVNSGLRSDGIVFQVPALSNCGSVYTDVDGNFQCGSGGATYSAGNGLTLTGSVFSLAANGSANYVTKWNSGNTLGYGVIYDNGTNVGIGTTSSATHRLAVNGSGLFLGTVKVATPTDSSDAVNKGYADSSSILWSRLYNFPANCSAGQYVTGMTSTTLTCASSTGSTYTAGAGLALVGSTFSLAASGTTNYLTKWTSNNALSSGIVFDNGTNVGIGTASPGQKLEVNGNIRTTIDNALPNLVLDSSSSGDNWTSQGAYISLGESGSLGAAALHLTYIGDGTSYIGSGAVTTGIPAESYLRFSYNSKNIYTNSNIQSAATGTSYFAGNVGIGTTSPVQKLSVNGTINAASGYRVANSAITGNYLRANGTAFVSSAIQAADVPTLNQNTTGSAYYLTSLDTRSTNSAPQDFGSLVKFDFKSNTTNGLSDGGSYNGVMTWRRYGTTTDWSGGPALQLAYSDNGNLWTRTGSSSWGAWSQILNNNSGVKLQATSPGSVQTGHIRISGDATLGGDLSVGQNKSLPALTLDSDGAGANLWSNQGAMIAIGEDASNGLDGAMYMTYYGNGSGYVGVGQPQADGAPNYSYWKFSPSANMSTNANVTVGGNLIFNGSLRVGSTERLNISATDTTGFTFRSSTSSSWMTLKTSAGQVLATIGDGGNSKLDVGTVDPIYTIGGTKYATYMAGMTGVKEETSGVLVLKKQSAGLFMAKLDFQNDSKGSDIWLFGRTTNLINNQDHFDQAACLLSANFSGQTWYEKDWSGRSINVFAKPDNNQRESVEVSYRLTAPRFDTKDWTNYSLSEHGGFDLDGLSR